MGETVSTMDDAALTADGLGFVDPDGVPKTELLVESNPTTSAAAAAAAAAGRHEYCLPIEKRLESGWSRHSGRRNTQGQAEVKAVWILLSPLRFSAQNPSKKHTINNDM